MSIKQHFKSEKYNFFKYRGKVRASAEAFNKRRDRYFFEKLGKKFNEEQLIWFFISSIVRTKDVNKWIGDSSGKDAYDLYLKTIGIHESLTYHFREDCKLLEHDYKLEEIFKNDNTYPPILTFMIREQISIETVALFEFIYGFTKYLDKILENDPVYTKYALIIKKYSMFFDVDKNKFKTIVKEVFNE